MASQRIGRYEIEKQILGGGMADVYLARDPNTERQVVIKVVKREYSDNDDFRARFRREAKVITMLEHPAIVPVYDFDEHEGQSFIVMRYMPGGSLLDRMKQGPLSLPEIARIVQRVADALDEAHEHGVIHRDLKPGNILFDAKGNAYLSDFGIAKKIAETTTGLATSGFIGTPAYASPEQIVAKIQLDGRSDVYSLGVLVFELLTGKLPFEADSPMGIVFAHVNDPVPGILKTRPDLPRESDSLIKRAMAKKPEDRYPTTGELAADLSKIATKPSKGQRPDRSWRPVGSEPAPPPKTPTPSPAPRTRPDTPPPGDLRPTGVIVETERPTRSLRPRRSGLPAWLLPAALLIVLCLAASIGGAFALPALLAPRTPAVGADTATAAVAATSVPATRAPTKTTAPPTATLTPVPVLGIGSTQVSEKDGMVMVYVPEGEFLMGSADSDADASSDEKPQHTVYLDAYWIDKTEVTNAMYALCVQAGVCSPPSSTGSSTRSSYYGDPQYDNYPVINVSWNDATAYCEWAGGRLPTEAEWEKAARGTDGRVYPWGNENVAGNLLNFCDSNCQYDWADKTVDDGYADTAPVGSYPDGASPYGALDMAGNVWEWVNDWYGSSYYGNSPSENPAGPSSGDARVLRGGSWYFYVSSVRAAGRGGYEPALRVIDFGFRCSLSP